MGADLKGVLQKPHLRNSEEEGSLGSSVVPVEVGEPGRRLGGGVGGGYRAPAQPLSCSEALDKFLD